MVSRKKTKTKKETKKKKRKDKGMDKLTFSIGNYVKAGFPILGINSYEPDVLQEQVTKEMQLLSENAEHNYVFHVYAWDIVTGLYSLSDKGAKKENIVCPSQILDKVKELPDKDRRIMR